MFTRDLGPHSFMSDSPHEKHNEWHSHFNAEERRHLIEEDLEARSNVFGVLIGVMLFGMSFGILAVLVLL